jgi:hypothetical protein
MRSEYRKIDGDSPESYAYWSADSTKRPLYMYVDPSGELLLTASKDLSQESPVFTLTWATEMSFAELFESGKEVVFIDPFFIMLQVENPSVDIGLAATTKDDKLVTLSGFRVDKDTDYQAAIEGLEEGDVLSEFVLMSPFFAFRVFTHQGNTFASLKQILIDDRIDYSTMIKVFAQTSFLQDEVLARGIIEELTTISE